ncbi:MAG: hypothetical protein A4E53_04255 [Pelotomaculum sp. PtaB.Bin104]|nr:MAG: hypothetical protein A4E53_04255 [Pelotomaculum sp. PtaB.Bin104]
MNETKKAVFRRLSFISFFAYFKGMAGKALIIVEYQKLHLLTLAR